MSTPLQVRMIVGEECATIEQLARPRTALARTVERARIVLLSHDSHSFEEVAETLGVCPVTGEAFTEAAD